MRHKYEVGQVVDIIPAPRQSNRPSGPCRVLHCMPFEGDRLQYRVQSLTERSQRVVYEDDLRPSRTRDDLVEAESHFDHVRTIRI